jgi:hypothetical protein
MRHHSRQYTATLEEIWFYLSVFFLIMNQFVSVSKMKLHKGRAISEDGADGRLEPTRISLFYVLPKGSKSYAGHCISHILSPFPKFLLLIKMTRGEIL